MSNLASMVQDFLAKHARAVVGVSEARDTGANTNYLKFKDAGYRVYALNPHVTVFDRDPCYPDLKSLPEAPDGVFILANPRVTEQIVRECADLGIPRVRMHCLMGVKPGLAAKMTSVSKPAVAMCRARGISVIPGSCPGQFLNPDPCHGLMRRPWRALGFLALPD